MRVPRVNRWSIVTALLVAGLAWGGAGCARTPDSPTPEGSRSAQPDLSLDEHVAVLAAAVSEGWFRFGLQSRAPAGHTFYAVEPGVPDAVLEALRRSPDLPPADIVWVKDLDSIAHDPGDGLFRNGYAVSIGEASIVAPETVEIIVDHHYGVTDTNPSNVRIARVDGTWSVLPPTPPQ